MITLNYRDGKPIYEQVMNGLRRLIVTGMLSPDEKLPSVRELAQQLAINPNTIQRAYRELERDGYIVSIPGKGSFAAAGDTADSGKRQAMLERFAELAAELRWMGVSQQELLERMEGGLSHGDT
ncbi:MAG: GntR family transcriptional regulator [Oscillospiraceae bacterium]|nr:GntR family transcriptional regulator [Oscillospiraceae bacterium]